MGGWGVLEGEGGLEALNCGGRGYGTGVAELGCEEPGGVAWSGGTRLTVRAMVGVGLWAWVELSWKGWSYGAREELYYKGLKKRKKKKEDWPG